MPSLDCSIIIPTFNTRDVTAQCIRSLLRQPPKIFYEIIVVDNHSSDGTTSHLTQEFPEIRILSNAANLGFSKACNRGAAIAQGRFLCFLNSDTVNGGAAIDRLVKWFADHPKTGIAGPELRSPERQLIQMSGGWNPILAGEVLQQFFAPYSLRNSAIKRRCVAWLQRKSTHVSIICGACLMIRRQAFDDINGFDEDFELYFEDSDLCYRCGKAGWKNDFVADAKITHLLGQSTRGSWTVTSLIYQQSHLSYYRKHAPGWAVWLLKAYLLMKWLRLRYVVQAENDKRDLSVPYCRAYMRMIFESQKITLETGIPQ